MNQASIFVRSRFVWIDFLLRAFEQDPNSERRHKIMTWFTHYSPPLRGFTWLLVLYSMRVGKDDEWVSV